MNLLSFFISTIIIVVLPGTGVIYTISNGITQGKRAGLYAALGCTLGIVPHLCFSTVLSSIILQLGDQVFPIVSIIGSIYLVYLGVKMLLSKSKLELHQVNKENTPFPIIWHSILINLLNPKLTIFFFSFLPQYLNHNFQNIVLQYVILGLLFMLLTLIVFCCYGILAGSISGFFTKSPKAICILQKIFGITFIAFAIRLFLQK